MDTARDKLTRNPDEEFIDPQVLIDRDDLTDNDKIRLLESWQADLLELLKAVEENMPSAHAEPGESAAKLAKVTAAIATLKERGPNDH